MFAEKMMKKVSFFMGVQVTFVLILWASFCSTAAAQTTAAIVGLVTDPSGAAIPDAKVTITHPATGQERYFQTDSTGNYAFTLLPIGDYSVRVEHAGFKTWAVPKVTLAGGDRLKLDASLEIGEVHQSVEVTGQTPALQTQNATLGTLVTSRATQDLPLNTRNFVALVQLGPGANFSTSGFGGAFGGGGGPDDRRQSSNITVNAQSAMSNNFLIDGMDNNERFVGTVVIKPSMDAIAEMKVQTNLYAADTGRTAGGVINLVTKSGTNSLHGSLFEFWRNEKLDAANFFAAPGSRPPYKQNIFGGSLGGPIKKDRTFFFGDFEGLHIRRGNTYVATVPTANMRNGDFSELLPTNQLYNPNTGAPFAGNIITSSEWDQVGYNLLQYYPEPTSSGLANNFTNSPPFKQDQNTFDVKIDHMISDRNAIYFRYSFADTDTVQPFAIPNGDGLVAGPSFQRSQGAQLNYIRTFSPRLVMALRAGYGRYRIDSLSGNAGKNLSEQAGLQGSNLDSVSSGLGAFWLFGATWLGGNFYVPDLNRNNIYQVNGDVTYQRGSHNLVFGADIRKRRVAETQSQSASGWFFFSGGATANPQTFAGGNVFASLMMGAPFYGDRTRQRVFPNYRFGEADAFVQDNWRVTPRLTFNLGLRYDYYSPISETRNQIANFDPTAVELVVAGENGVSDTAGVKKDWVNLSPRFGFAAMLSQRTVLRGGYGISFVPVPMGTGYALRNGPFMSTWNMPAGWRLSDGMPLTYIPNDPTNPAGVVFGAAFDMEIPYVQQFNLTLQRELPAKLVASVGYVGLLGRKSGSVDANEPFPGNPATVQQRRPYYSKFPNLTNVFLLGGLYTNSSYNGLQATLERRFEQGLGFVANYTWSHALDNNDYRPLATGGIFSKANSSMDLRHRFTLTLGYE
ncbi:MAG: TonB-dependent receptor, partial [Acidobacteria bacterium]|nr:TonB-dependent receptor [Acidobacteriota bacterium]